MNVELDTLLSKTTNGRIFAYCYIIATIENQTGTFVQRGSAPNFQGDWITLCTCKHYMRTFMSPAVWEGKWIAGFTGSKVSRERNYLVYLMRVSHAFESHRDFWFSGVASAKARQAKAANLDRFGDIYQPGSEAAAPFDPSSYIPPCNDHVHSPHDWYDDIAYCGCSGRRAALLVGDPQHSFLWDHPMIYSSFKLYRGQKKLRMSNLLSQLKMGQAL